MRGRPYGERATVLELDVADARDAARRARSVRHAILERRPDLDVVAGGDRVLVLAPIEDALAACSGLELDGAIPARGTTHLIDVVYDGEDLAGVASSAAITTERLIELHTETEYEVEVVGFLPGFAYLGEVPACLRQPRRASPRPRVPAGSVALAARYTAVYPFASPGGWNLLGRAVEPMLFDPSRDPPARFQPGDRVRFRAVRASITAPEVPAEPAGEGGELEIVRCTPHATIQDLGRAGRRGQGIPASGAWDRATHVRTNRALGNADGAATIELPFGGLVATATTDLDWSVDGEPPRRARAGDRIEVVASAGAVRYFGVRGGFSTPLVLGSRSTLVSAGFGGHRGRRLTRGDRLPVERLGAHLEGTTSDAPRDAEEVTRLRVVVGPDVDELPRDAYDVLLSTEWTVSSRLDRTGTRLAPDARLAYAARPDGAPRPTLPGAVQITPDGTPILLGPDAAVTGGYPVALVLGEEARDAAARLRPTRRIRFVE